MFTLTILLSFFRWIFNYDFDLATRRCAAILDNHVSSKSWISVAGFLLFALILTLLWEFVLYLRSPDLSTSPVAIVEAAYQLFTDKEIYGTLFASGSELVGGYALGGLVSAVAYALLSGKPIIRKWMV